MVKDSADLIRWRLVEDFRQRLEKQLGTQSAHPSWKDPRRELQLCDYLSLFLLGLFNPVVRTMRGLCAASALPRVQSQVCRRPVSLGSFSEAQALVDPELLGEIFSELSEQVLREKGAGKLAPANRRWLVQDGSLFKALPRMYWALWRKQHKEQAQVRLHLSFDLSGDAPARALITPGRLCERKSWKALLRPGDAYVADRYYGEDYQLLAELEEQSVAFVVRLRDEAVIQTEESLPVSANDAAAGVRATAWVKLGCRKQYESPRLRVVWVRTPKEELPLVTNLGPEELSAGEVALLYKERWRIELFFRWVKCILGCRHWLAESPEGVALEIYLALIAALLLQLYTGQRPNRRMMEVLQFYAMGVATVEDVLATMRRQQAKQKKK